MNATNDRKSVKTALTKLMAGSALLAAQTDEDLEFWADVEASLDHMDKPARREPVVQERAG